MTGLLKIKNKKERKAKPYWLAYNLISALLYQKIHSNTFYVQYKEHKLFNLTSQTFLSIRLIQFSVMLRYLQYIGKGKIPVNLDK